MSRHLSQPVAAELVAVARRVVAGVDTGDIRPEPGREKMLADLRQKAAHALELGRQRPEEK